ncbi:Rv3654c family TadE-like protein [Nakamurella flava]|uniref:Rv3654c family TadE-like protein n=1 Tax=Nakamurella flava TaxID=2576308 RepID=UPI00197BE54C|nr:Rv3654c family TadE-like protein [Nakamurella flava]
MATVLVAAGLAALLVVLVAATWLAAAVTARHRAGAAADLAALAGAAVVVRGADAVCAAAVRVAEANGAGLDSCRVTGVTVRVTTTVDVRVGPVDGSADGRAQAGPVSDVGVRAAGGSGDDAVPDAP